MSTQIITASYNNAITVSFTNDAWFNATEVAKQYSKRPNDFLNLKETKEYVTALHGFLFPNLPLPVKMVAKENQLVRTVNGGKQGEFGSWFHPKLAVAFARWLSVDFSIWCDMQIEKLLHPVPYGLKEKAYPEMVAKPHFITRNMERHLKHHVDILVRQSNLTPNKIWRDFCAYFLIDSWQNLPMQNYVAACRYFEIEPIYTPECNNNFVYVDLSKFEEVQNENKTLRDKVTVFTKEQRDMFRPQEAVESLKKLGFTVLSGVDDDKMVMISVDELEELRTVRPFIQSTKHFIQYLDEATDQGYRFVKKSDLIDLSLKVMDLGI